MSNLQRVNLTNCDREPIHIPGAILPHGAMLVLSPDTLEIVQVAGATQALLGHAAESLLGKNADVVFTAQQLAHVRELCARGELARPRHLLDPALRVADGLPLDAAIHHSDGALVLELEAGESGGRGKEALTVVQEMVEGLAGTTPREFCQSAAEGVRAVTGYDRVMVYQFLEDASGWVIAESKQDGLEPFLDLHYPASDIPVQARALYLRNWLRVIPSVDYEPAALKPAANPQTGRPLDMSQALLRNVAATTAARIVRPKAAMRPPLPSRPPRRLPPTTLPPAPLWQPPRRLPPIRSPKPPRKLRRRLPRRPVEIPLRPPLQPLRPLPVVARSTP